MHKLTALESWNSKNLICTKTIWKINYRCLYNDLYLWTETSYKVGTLLTPLTINCHAYHSKCDRLCEKGPYCFSKFSTLVIYISSSFKAITFILHQTKVQGIAGPSFNVVLNSQIQPWDSKCVWLGSAIRLLFAEPVTNKSSGTSLCWLIQTLFQQMHKKFKLNP